MIRSTPAFKVCVDAGHVTHAPISSTETTPDGSSTSMSKMSPLSAWITGRMISITSCTLAHMADEGAVSV